MDMDNKHIERKIQALDEWIKNNSDSRELKRAMAVKLTLRGWKYSSITQCLNVSNGFISKWNKRFNEFGLDGLKLSYKGSSGYLTKQQKQDVINWLNQDDNHGLEKVKRYLREKYDINFKSNSSYYNLIKEAQNCFLQFSAEYF
ncbi:MAG: helix-turn-helix domain-containing protein [Coleofasciculus sp. B1-GNL1-01]|uniref:helix-turn-helix domain-containing protein n=1 Tax=Coleofasciculus sp. B1-GNL1-01 TaxID=3068484 RepID=UPI003301A96C